MYASIGRSNRLNSIVEVHDHSYPSDNEENLPFSPPRSIRTPSEPISNASPAWTLGPSASKISQPIIKPSLPPSPTPSRSLVEVDEHKFSSSTSVLSDHPKTLDSAVSVNDHQYAASSGSNLSDLGYKAAAGRPISVYGNSGVGGGVGGGGGGVGGGGRQTSEFSYGGTNRDERLPSEYDGIMKGGPQPSEYSYDGMIKNGMLPADYTYGGAMKDGRLPGDYPYGGATKDGRMTADYPYGGATKDGRLPGDYPYGGATKDGRLPGDYPYGGATKDGRLPTGYPYGEMGSQKQMSDSGKLLPDYMNEARGRSYPGSSIRSVPSTTSLGDRFSRQMPGQADASSRVTFRSGGSDAEQTRPYEAVYKARRTRTETLTKPNICKPLSVIEVQSQTNVCYDIEGNKFVTFQQPQPRTKVCYEEIRPTTNICCEEIRPRPNICCEEMRPRPNICFEQPQPVSNVCYEQMRPRPTVCFEDTRPRTNICFEEPHNCLQNLNNCMSPQDMSVSNNATETRSEQNQNQNMLQHIQSVTNMSASNNAAVLEPATVADVDLNSVQELASWVSKEMDGPDDILLQCVTNLVTKCKSYSSTEDDSAQFFSKKLTGVINKLDSVVSGSGSLRTRSAASLSSKPNTANQRAVVQTLSDQTTGSRSWSRQSQIAEGTNRENKNRDVRNVASDTGRYSYSEYDQSNNRVISDSPREDQVVLDSGRLYNSRSRTRTCQAADERVDKTVSFHSEDERLECPRRYREHGESTPYESVLWSENVQQYMTSTPYQSEIGRSVDSNEEPGYMKRLQSNDSSLRQNVDSNERSESMQYQQQQLESTPFQSQNGSSFDTDETLDSTQRQQYWETTRYQSERDQNVESDLEDIQIQNKYTKSTTDSSELVPSMDTNEQLNSIQELQNVKSSPYQTAFDRTVEQNERLKCIPEPKQQEESVPFHSHSDQMMDLSEQMDIMQGLTYRSETSEFMQEQHESATSESQSMDPSKALAGKQIQQQYKELTPYQSESVQSVDSHERLGSTQEQQQCRVATTYQSCQNVELNESSTCKQRPQNNETAPHHGESGRSVYSDEKSEFMQRLQLMKAVPHQTISKGDRSWHVNEGSEPYKESASRKSQSIGSNSTSEYLQHGASTPCERRCSQDDGNGGTVHDHETLVSQMDGSSLQEDKGESSSLSTQLAGREDTEVADDHSDHNSCPPCIQTTKDSKPTEHISRKSSSTKHKLCSPVYRTRYTVLSDTGSIDSSYLEEYCLSSEKKYNLDPSGSHCRQTVGEHRYDRSQSNQGPDSRHSELSVEAESEDKTQAISVTACKDVLPSPDSGKTADVSGFLSQEQHSSALSHGCSVSAPDVSNNTIAGHDSYHCRTEPNVATTNTPDERKNQSQQALQESVLDDQVAGTSEGMTDTELRSPAYSVTNSDNILLWTNSRFDGLNK